MKYFVLLICVNILFTAYIFAQTPNAPFKKPDVKPVSPEVASLGRYGDIAVGEYSGAANISIPIHTLKAGKLNFPINLYYNSNGIKVSEEATWVGLGWNLSAVAGITYVPLEGNDQNYIAYTPWSDWSTTINWINPYKIYPSVGNEDDFMRVRCTLEEGVIDKTPPNVIGAASANGARDMYSVNCMGLIFKFYIHPETNQAKIFGDKNNCKIEIINGNINTGFKITDNNGVIYSFRQLEASLSMSNVNCWYITEIKRPDGDWINFKYTNFGSITPIPPLSEQFMYKGSSEVADVLGYSPRRTQNLAPNVKNQYLTEIESSTELVRFNVSNNRLDLSGLGARRLDSILVTDKFSGRQKSFAFEYDYFEGVNIGGNYLNDGTDLSAGFTEDNLKKRLKLLKVIQKGKIQSENKVYSFDYNIEKPLPWKTSFAIDHWGNYNGMENISNLLNFNGSRRTIVPMPFSVFLYDSKGQATMDTDKIYNGAFRGANELFIGAGSLKSITYPTGGKTTFEFEPHSFNNYTVLSAQEEQEGIKIGKTNNGIHIFDLNYPNGTDKHYGRAEFRLPYATTVKFFARVHNSGGKFSCEQMKYNEIRLIGVPSAIPNLVWRATCADHNPTTNELKKTWTQSIDLKAGIYIFTVDVEPSIGFQGYDPLILATIEYSLPGSIDQIVAKHVESIGGGLRIKRIFSSDKDGNILTDRKYKYLNKNGRTSGKLITPLNYSDVTRYSSGTYISLSCNLGTVNSLIFNSNNNISLSTSPIKASIGYDRVEILDVNSSDIAANGKIVKTFTNQDKFLIFLESVILNDGNSNGELLSETHFNKDGVVLKSDSLFYSQFLQEKDWINLKVKNIYVGSNDCQCSEPKRHIIASYAYLNYKDFLSKKIETNYFNNQKVRRETEFEYNLANFEVSEKKTTDSKNQLFTTKYKYPHDFAASDIIYEAMVRNNMVSPVISETKIKGETEQLERTISNYAIISNFIQPISVQKQIRSENNRSLVTYNKYSVGGNLAEYQANDGVYHSVIWGYGQSSPIAFIENSHLSDVFYTGFEDDEGNSTIDDCKTGHKSRKGGYTKLLSGLSNGDYNYTYWAKNKSTWALQSQRISVTAGTFTIVIESGVQIDDIRFYPVKAQMISQTFDPLAGVTSTTDQNNQVTSYEYDNFHRLKYVKDQNGNIVKNYDYNYKH